MELGQALPYGITGLRVWLEFAGTLFQHRLWGPTIQGVDPGQPFPLNTPAAVNSPVEVIVNGKSAEVLGAVGYPGAVDRYQVNFSMPADTATGVATIQVIAAWISGSPVSIAVQ
jgi:uncharacterized protein (TIGR03437 family)